MKKIVELCVDKELKKKKKITRGIRNSKRKWQRSCSIAYFLSSRGTNQIVSSKAVNQ